MSTKLNRVLFVPDTHAPFHDAAAWRAMIEFARKWKPTHIIVLGDLIDCCAISSHSKDPRRMLDFKHEVDVARGLLRELATLGASQRIFIAGNHEDRLTRYLRDKAPELHEMIDIPTMLDLRAAGFSYVAYRSFYTLGKLYATHDVGVAGKYAHYQVGEVFGRNVVSAHNHRMGLSVSGTIEGERHVSATFGWLGDASEIDYMSKAKVTKDWTHGFGIGYLEPKSGYVTIVAVPIVNGRVILPPQ